MRSIVHGDGWMVAVGIDAAGVAGGGSGGVARALGGAVTAGGAPWVHAATNPTHPSKKPTDRLRARLKRLPAHDGVA